MQLSAELIARFELPDRASIAPVVAGSAARLMFLRCLIPLCYLTRSTDFQVLAGNKQENEAVMS